MWWTRWSSVGGPAGFEVGSWLAEHRVAVLGTRAYPILNAEWGGATTTGGTIYAHVLDAPPDGTIHVPLEPGANVTVRYFDGSPATFERTTEGVRISRVSPHGPDTVLVIA